MIRKISHKHHRELKTVLFAAGCLLILSVGCAKMTSFFSGKPSVQMLYVLAGSFPKSDYPTAFYGVDPQTWEITHSTDLPGTQSSVIAQDAQGRVWVDADGILWGRVQLYSARGRWLNSISPCPEQPIAGIHFSPDYAFIVCDVGPYLNSVVEVYDLKSLRSIKHIILPLYDAYVGCSLRVTEGGSAADNGYVLISGWLSCLPSNARDTDNSWIVLIDTHTLEIHAQLEPLAYGQINEVVANKGKFYLLLRKGNPSLLMVDPIKPVTVMPKPLPHTAAKYGTIYQDALYIYHEGMCGVEQICNKTQNQSFTAMTRMSLESNRVETLWFAVGNNPLAISVWDMTIVNGKIIFVDSIHGLAQFDPASGTASKVVDAYGATKLFWKST